MRASYFGPGSNFNCLNLFLQCITKRIYPFLYFLSTCIPYSPPSFHPPSLSTPITYTSNQPTVRPSPLLPSRPRLKRHFPRLRHLRHPDFRLHNRLRHLRRQMGPAPINHLRRPRAPLVHGPHRLLICNRQRACDIRSGQMDCDSGDLCFCGGVLDE